MTRLTIPARIRTMINAGALIVVNHSGGKDSQAMTVRIREIVPTAQILVVHAPLAEIEWPGTLEHITATIGELPLILAKATKTFFDMVEHRGLWPSPKYRQCTSDLKRTPIDREIRRHLKANPHFEGRIVSCMGLRGRGIERPRQGRDRQAKRPQLESRPGLDRLAPHSRAHDDRGFRHHRRRRRGAPFGYAAGMSRLSCCFCIMASRADLTRAAELRPDLYRHYVETERRLDQTFVMPRNGRKAFLEEITGVAAQPCAAPA